MRSEPFGTNESVGEVSDEEQRNGAAEGIF